MTENFFSLAVSLAKMLLDTREQFAEAVRMAAIARIEGNPMRNVYTRPADISRSAVEPHVDDALYAIARDGLRGLEDNVRAAVDEIVLEALNAGGKGALRD
jgi:hypothetical protein